MTLLIGPRAMVVIAAAGLFAPARQARADSDGYYCVGAGFLAVEFRSFNTPGLPAAQVVRIARLDTTRGPHWTDQVAVEDFQPHVMACGMTTVLLEGASGHGLVSYELTVDSTGKATITRRSGDPAYRFRGVAPAEPANLGNWARPGMTKFFQFGAGAFFQLHVTEHERRISPAVIRHDLRSTVELVIDGHVRDSLIVSEGHRLETIDNEADSDPSRRRLTDAAADGRFADCSLRSLFFDPPAAELGR